MQDNKCPSFTARAHMVMKKRQIFTAEELAELAAFDAEVDAAPAYDKSEIKASRHRDNVARLERLDHRERALAERMRAYYEANKAQIAERQRAYREANKAQIAEYQRAYYEANKAQIAERQRAYREANKAQIAERQRAYREANKAQIAERQRAYREANKAQIAEYKRAYYGKSSSAHADKSPLRAWRKDRGLRQSDIAKLIGVTKGAVSMMERGVIPLSAKVMEVINAKT